MSLYDELGVPADASPDEIQAAYRAQAKQHHPDKGGDADRFARLGRAVAVLRDPERRAEYDRTGREDFSEAHPDQGARTQLMQAFSAMLAQFVEGRIVATQDLMVLTRRELAERAREQRAEAKKVTQFIKRAEDALARLVSKSEGPDLLRNMIEERNTEAGKVLAQMTTAANNLERAAELAEGWDWRADEAVVHMSTPGSGWPNWNDLDVKGLRGKPRYMGLDLGLDLNTDFGDIGSSAR